MKDLPKGTIERLYIDITDRLNNLASLDTATITFEIWDSTTDVDDEDGPVLTGDATNEGMTVITDVVDTSTFEEGDYRMFVTIGLEPESIKLGPFRFTVG